MVDMLVNDFLGPGQRELPSWMPFTCYEQLVAMEASLQLQGETANVDTRIRNVWLELTPSLDAGKEPRPRYPCVLVLQEAANKFGLWDPTRKKFTDASRIALTTSAEDLLSSMEENAGCDPEATEDKEITTFRDRVNWLWSEMDHKDPFREECPVLQILANIERDRRGTIFHTPPPSTRAPQKKLQY